MVIDADGLNALTNKTDTLQKIKNSVVLTPHPGEMSRLAGLGFARDVQQERMNTAAQFVQSIQKKITAPNKLVLVLKGDKTIVNDYRKVYVNRSGNPGMATAGSGDVLTGVIVSLIGQGFDVFDASQLGVYLHGLAGDIAAKKKGELSMIASDIIEYLPDAFKQVKSL